MTSLSDATLRRVDEEDPGLTDGVGDGGDAVAGDDGEQTRSRRKTVVEAVYGEGLDIPKVTLQTATPTPQARLATSEDNNGEEDIDSEEDEMEEDVEEEEAAMTQEEKTEMYEAVKTGDIDWLEDCLDKPNSDINMMWYKENLLMAAIRNGQQEMAEFLLDNGVDHSFTATVVGLRLTPKGKMLDRYELSCRQMAYDRNMLDIVELIDILQGRLFSFIRPAQRTPRYRRQNPPTPSESGDSGSDDADVSSNASASVDSDRDGNVEKKRKKKKKEKHHDSIVNVENDSVDPTPNANRPGSGSGVKCGSDKTEPFKGGIKSTLVSGGNTARGHLPYPNKPEHVDGGQNEDKSSVSSKCKSQPDPHDKQTRNRTPRPASCIESAARLSVVRSQYRRFPPSRPSSLSPEEPLRWRKVSTVGSYTRESKNWHAEKCPVFESTDIIDIRPHRPSSAQSQSSTVQSTTTSSSFLPKSILIKSRASSFASEKNLTFAREPPEVQDVTTGNARFTEPVKVVKRKLDPSFVNSYRALDFC